MMFFLNLLNIDNQLNFFNIKALSLLLLFAIIS